MNPEIKTPTQCRVEAHRHVAMALTELMIAEREAGTSKENQNLVEAIYDVRLVVRQLSDRIEKGEV